jgi:hypothetical protein
LSGAAESFNARLCDELLNGEIFFVLNEVVGPDVIAVLLPQRDA